MTRLFIAVAIPAVITAGIAGLGGSIPGARPVPVEQMHLTLKFIGEMEGSRVLDIRGALSEISRPPFAIELRGVGVFPPRGIPRVLWAGVTPQDELVALRQVIEKKLTEIAIPREKTKYTPHLTLARLNNAPLRHLQQLLASNALLQSPEFTVAAFTLYSSRLSSKGAMHTALETYALKQPRV